MRPVKQPNVGIQTHSISSSEGSENDCESEPDNENENSNEYTRINMPNFTDPCSRISSDSSYSSEESEEEQSNNENSDESSKNDSSVEVIHLSDAIQTQHSQPNTADQWFLAHYL